MHYNVQVISFHRKQTLECVMCEIAQDSKTYLWLHFTTMAVLRMMMLQETMET